MLTIHMTNSAFWLTVLFTFVAMAICFIDSLMQQDGQHKSISHVAGFVLAIFLIVLMFGKYGPVNSTMWKSKVISELYDEKFVEGETYHSVEFLGKKSVVMNPSDSLYYIDMGNGAVVSYNRILRERMCRTCKQFTYGDISDSAFVYRVQKSKPRFWNSGPLLIFSKSQDLLLQGSQSLEVITKK